MEQTKKQKSIVSTKWEKRGPIFFLLIISCVVAIATITVLLFMESNRTYPTDCEIARIVYDEYPDPLGSFDEFLEERFRTYGIESPGGLFSNPIYSFALFYPKEISIKFESYDYQISRGGKLYSKITLSILQEEWESGQKINCNNTK